MMVQERNPAAYVRTTSSPNAPSLISDALPPLPPGHQRHAANAPAQTARFEAYSTLTQPHLPTSLPSHLQPRTSRSSASRLNPPYAFPSRSFLASASRAREPPGAYPATLPSICVLPVNKPPALAPSPSPPAPLPCAACAALASDIPAWTSSILAPSAAVVVSAWLDGTAGRECAELDAW